MEDFPAFCSGFKQVVACVAQVGLQPSILLTPGPEFWLRYVVPHLLSGWDSSVCIFLCKLQWNEFLQLREDQWGSAQGHLHTKSSHKMTNLNRSFQKKTTKSPCSVESRLNRGIKLLSNEHAGALKYSLEIGSPLALGIL